MCISFFLSVKSREVSKDFLSAPSVIIILFVYISSGLGFGPGQVIAKRTHAVRGGTLQGIELRKKKL